MVKIRIAIAGVGNCASSLVQGLHYYTPSRCSHGVSGLMHVEIGNYRPCDIEVVAAFDIDKRKVGLDLNQAIFSKPNCATVFQSDLPPAGVVVQMGRVLDGISEHMADFEDDRTFLLAAHQEPVKAEVVRKLKGSGAEMLLNYMPVGSEEATKFYADCALEAGIGFINNMPVFIASNSEYADKFKARNLPLLGDDIKSQLGATIVHRMLTDLAHKRGVKIRRTYQLNTGGNTDFLNMKNQDRLTSKKISKTEAVQSVSAVRIKDNNIHVGPSDYVPWQNDNKICFIRVEGYLFGDVPTNIELRLSVEDSPNSAGVVIDLIRCCKLALMAGEGGVLEGPSAYFFKHPPRQFTDDEAYQMVEEFIASHVTIARAVG